MEEWKSVVGNTNYEVSSEGRVRSLSRTITLPTGGSRRVAGRTLKASGSHYPVVFLGRGNCRSVHSLVAEAFVPNPHNLPMVRHLNDDPLDARACNLTWGEQSDNMDDAVRNGKHGMARRNACAKGHEYVEGSWRIEKGRGDRTIRRCLACRKK